MGHNRLPRLERTFDWKQVIQALSSSDASIAEIISLTSKASQKILTDSKYIDGLAYCFWLFTNIAQASRGRSFVNELNNLGISVSKSDSGLDILKKIYDSASNSLKSSANFSMLDNIALDSFKSAIYNTITRESKTLFGCDLESVQRAFKKYSTPGQVSYLGREFFSQYMYKSFSYTLEKELANSIGQDKRFHSSNDIERFNSRLKTYCWDVSKIVEEFSGGWYGKASYLGTVSNKEKTLDFTKYAMTKLLSEVRRDEQ